MGCSNSWPGGRILLVAKISVQSKHIQRGCSSDFDPSRSEWISCRACSMIRTRHRTIVTPACVQHWRRKSQAVCDVWWFSPKLHCMQAKDTIRHRSVCVPKCIPFDETSDLWEFKLVSHAGPSPSDMPRWARKRSADSFRTREGSQASFYNCSCCIQAN